MENSLSVGEVLKPQGIRGELKVKPFTDSPETFKEFKSVDIDGAEYKILSCRTGDGFVYLGLKGVADRNAAERLRGKLLSVPREDAPELPEGRYYIADLLGAEAYFENGAYAGTVKDVLKNATDVYVLEKDGKDILFPASAGVILKIDIESKRMVLDEKRFRETAVL